MTRPLAATETLLRPKSPESERVRTRFAPSPTGYLHLGHAASALFVWGLGKALGGRVLLRIEDHDRGRCRPEFETATFADLAWLGFVPDEPPTRQSDRTPLYERSLATLRKNARVYGCDCTRKRLSSLDRSPESAEGELRYDGHCRDRGIPADRPGAGVRVVIPDEEIAFTDLKLGPRRHRPAAQAGDLLLRDRHGQWTYQFAAVVDDLAQDVTLVVRGEDLAESTGRQILLARLLGRDAPPAFYHHPLIVDAAGKKLSKRFYAEAIAKRREEGAAAAVVLGEAASLTGLLASPAPLDGKSVAALFAREAARITALLPGGT
jgi:glutamyl-tRNA synthetase/glutamyl-Q tRNA(Asp) synthetase